MRLPSCCKGKKCTESLTCCIEWPSMSIYPFNTTYSRPIPLPGTGHCSIVTLAHPYCFTLQEINPTLHASS